MFIELPSTRIVALSSTAARLLHIEPAAATVYDLLAMVEPQAEMEQTLRLLSAGVVDRVDARCSVRRTDEPTLRVRMSAHAVRRGARTDILLSITDDAVTPSPATDASTLVGMLDDRWRIAELVNQTSSFLGYSCGALIGSSIFDMTHPADAAVLLGTFALATSGTNHGVSVRVRDGHGAFRSVTATATMLPDGASHFAFVLAVEGARATPLPELSDRQWEVVTRLHRGERVLTIAAAMYLSQSTIRNHLSAIFDKVGVHSQRELLEVLRPDQIVPLERTNGTRLGSAGADTG